MPGLLEQIARALGVVENAVALGADAQRAVDRTLDMVEERQRIAELERRRALRAARAPGASGGRKPVAVEPARMTVPPALEARLWRLSRIASHHTGKIITPTILLGLLVELAERAAIKGERGAEAPAPVAGGGR